MNRTLVAISLMLFAQSAFADESLTPDILNQDIQAAAAAIRHIAQDQAELYRENIALKAEIAKLKAPAVDKGSVPH